MRRPVPGAAALAVLTLVTGCSSERTEPANLKTNDGPAASSPDPLPGERPDQRYIVSGEDGTYVADPASGRARKVFDLPGVWEFQPDVSPDGRRVAVRVDDEGPRAGTWVVGIDGSSPLHLSRVAGVSGGSPDWAPDGRSLVIAGRRKGDRYLGLWIVDVARARARRITPDEWEAQYPAWSPDGRSIAFTRVVPPDDFSIFVVRPDGSALRRLSPTDNNDNYAAWSPNGKQLVFHSERTSDAGLWIMDADGSGERFLSEGGEPQWEPGRWIIFNCALSSERARVCAIAPNGSDAIVLPLDRQAGFPNWLP